MRSTFCAPFLVHTLSSLAIPLLHLCVIRIIHLSPFVFQQSRLLIRGDCTKAYQQYNNRLTDGS